MNYPQFKVLIAERCVPSSITALLSPKSQLSYKLNVLSPMSQCQQMMCRYRDLLSSE